jgi:hypothetical protein
MRFLFSSMAMAMALALIVASALICSITGRSARFILAAKLDAVRLGLASAFVPIGIMRRSFSATAT